MCLSYQLIIHFVILRNFYNKKQTVFIKQLNNPYFVNLNALPNHSSANSNASCRLREKDLEQKSALRRKFSEKNSKTRSQPILKVRTVQLPMSFIFKIIAKKISALRSAKIKYQSILLYFLVYKSSLENVTHNSENKFQKQSYFEFIFLKKNEKFSVSL